MFSLDQHEEGSSTFRLLEELCQSNGIEVDFDQGTLKLSVAEEQLYDGIAGLVKVVLAMNSVVPHIRVHRPRGSSLGPRLRSKIARRYQELNILKLVERYYRLEGAKGPSWTIDFHWPVQSNGNVHAVNVVTADLGVSQPLAKAHRIVALSVDTAERHRQGDDQLRVVIETGPSSAQSTEAGDFLRFHSEQLAYSVFDLGREPELEKFYDISMDELTNRAPQPWREVMLSRQ